MEKTKIQEVQKVLGLILFANIFVAILKIVIGKMIFSQSMVADGVHSLSDGSTNIIGIIGVRLSTKPSDEEHPYGHRKIEIIASMVIGVILVLVGLKLGAEAIAHFSNPIKPEVSVVSILALLGTLVINVTVTTYEKRKGIALDSAILVADSNHTKTDIFVTIGVLLGLIAIQLGCSPIIDPLITLLVVGFIFHAAWEIFRDNGNILLDGVALPVDEVKEKVLTFKEIRDVHNIRSRGISGAYFIDMHLWVDPEMTVRESHRLEHEIRTYLKQCYGESTEIMLHIEPDEEMLDKENELR